MNVLNLPIHVPTQIINKAINEALLSTHRYKIGAVIYKRNKIISSGHNYPSRSLRNLNPKFRKWKTSVHAEVDAIFNARTPLKNMNIFVLRINKSFDFRLAKPCKYCELYLNHIGIRKIYYSINEYPFINILK